MFECRNNVFICVCEDIMCSHLFGDTVFTCFDNVFMCRDIVFICFDRMFSCMYEYVMCLCVCGHHIFMYVWICNVCMCVNVIWMSYSKIILLHSN